MAKLKTLISKAWRLSAPIPTAVAIAVVLGGVFSANIWGWLGLLLYNAVFSILFLFDFFAVREGGIRVERRCPSRLFEGIPQTVDIIARNTGIRPLLLQIRDQTPVGWSPAPYLFGKLGPRDTVRLHYEIDPTERGSFSFGNLWVRVDGPLRLARRQIRVPAERTGLGVSPVRTGRVYEPGVFSAGNPDLGPEVDQDGPGGKGF